MPFAGEPISAAGSEQHVATISRFAEYCCRRTRFATSPIRTGRCRRTGGAARFGPADFAPTAFHDRYSQNERPKRLLSVTTKQPFISVVSDHGATVLRVCRVIVGPVDADDAWSETFLSALKLTPPTYRPKRTSRPGW